MSALLSSRIASRDPKELGLVDMSNWAVPLYSRTQVDKAGATWIDSGATGDELAWALDVINNWRSAHSYPLLNFRVNLRRKVKTIEPGTILAQRIKRLQSIEAKLRRSSMQFSQMQDIGGCRAVLKTVSNVEYLVSSYKRSKFSHVLVGEKDYIASPKPDGYRSHHLIYQYKSKPGQISSYDKLRIEIQIRTLLQHAWATAVEAVGIFTKQALKANVGSPEWLRLFTLMSAEIAVIEKMPLGPNVPPNEADRVNEIKVLSKKLKAVESLNSYRSVINWATNKERADAKYFLIAYDYSDNKTYVTAFPGTQSEQANAAYTAAESKWTPQARSIVLVSVDSVQVLKRAYPNYFLDTQQFTSLLTSVLKK